MRSMSRLRRSLRLDSNVYYLASRTNRIRGAKKDLALFVGTVGRVVDESAHKRMSVCVVVMVWKSGGLVMGQH